MAKLGWIAGILLVSAQGVSALDPAQAMVTKSFSQAALVGMQLAVKKVPPEGKYSTAVLKCVQSLKPNSFDVVFATLISRDLTTEELLEAENFYTSAVGKKYARLGLMQTYSAVGEPAPAAIPVISQSEYQEIENFSRTPAGDKLMVKKIFEAAPAQQVISSRVQELLKKCGHRT